MPAILLRYRYAIYPSLLALANRHDPICVAPPKVAKASEDGAISPMELRL
jgi:hypothetical protein